MCSLVGIQLLLLVRFVLKLIDPEYQYDMGRCSSMICGVFVLPFRLLLQNIAVPISTAFEMYTLLAILAYGLLSRLLVRFLRALLGSR